jgi:hypothetical protein
VIFAHALFFPQIQKVGSVCTTGQGQTRLLSKVRFFLVQGFFGDFPLVLNPPTLVDQVADFFRTTHKVKTQQVVESRGQYCGDIELAGYLTNESGPVPLVMDLRIPHDRVGSSTDPSLNGHLKYPNNLDQSLNDTSADKIRKYRADYNE